MASILSILSLSPAVVFVLLVGLIFWFGFLAFALSSRTPRTTKTRAQLREGR